MWHGLRVQGVGNPKGSLWAQSYRLPSDRLTLPSLASTAASLAMLETVPAALIVVACLVMLLRLGLGERRRRRFDAAWREVIDTLSGRARAVWHRRSSRQAARRLADEALRRARRGVDRDGNVIRPEAFKPPRKPH